MLSIGARGLFREMMTELADDDGVIQCGQREPHAAVCFALGATKSDRQQVRRWLGELLDDGCVVLDGGQMRLPNWHAYQAEQATSKSVRAARKRRPSGDLAATLEQPSGDPEPAFVDLRPAFVDLCGPKPAESLTRGGQRRGEESTTYSPSGRARGSTILDCPDPLGEHDSVTSLELVWRAWVATGRERAIVSTEADRRRDLRHVESIERATIELAPIAAKRWDVGHGEAAKMILMTAMGRFGAAYDAERKPDAKGRRQLEWRLGWVASRWPELTAGAIPAEAAE